ncbi:retrotransposon hot spot (RHS) protein [Trypanosoma cruzi]|nr:retrotransposon hot spot (RHS) protein [Trypanosoma cruzi]
MTWELQRICEFLDSRGPQKAFVYVRSAEIPQMAYHAVVFLHFRTWRRGGTCEGERRFLVVGGAQRPATSRGISVSICNCAQQSAAVIDGMCIYFGGNIAANSLPLHLPLFFSCPFWIISESGQRPRRLFSVVSLSVSLLSSFLPSCL